MNKGVLQLPPLATGRLPTPIEDHFQFRATTVSLESFSSLGERSFPCEQKYDRSGGSRRYREKGTIGRWPVALTVRWPHMRFIRFSFLTYAMAEVAIYKGGQTVANRDE